MLVGLPLAAPIVLCGSERVLVVSTEPLFDLSRAGGGNIAQKNILIQACSGETLRDPAQLVSSRPVRAILGPRGLRPGGGGGGLIQACLLGVPMAGKRRPQGLGRVAPMVKRL